MYAYLNLAFSVFSPRKEMSFWLLCPSLEQDHVEGYLELSAKTKIYFATAVATWDADFYVKVDDDVHVNIGNFKFCLQWYILLLQYFFMQYDEKLKDVSNMVFFRIEKYMDTSSTKLVI